MMRPNVSLTDGARRTLAGYGWPGNIRELENVLERAIVLAASDRIDEKDLAIEPMAGPAAVHAGPTMPGGGGATALEIDYKMARDRFEREYLTALIRRAGGNMTRAALLSGISRRNLYDKLEKVGLHSSELRDE